MSRTSRKRRGFLSWRSIAVVLVLVMAWYGYREFRGASGRTGNPTQSRRVPVPKGASVREVTKALADSGIIHWPRLFRWYAAIGGRDRLIKPSTYQFGTGAGWSYVLDVLISGKGLVQTVTVPEGFDLREIVPLLARTLSVPEDSVRAAVADTAWQRRLDIPLPSLEGYLFPATYSFPEGTTAREAVGTMLETFESEWARIPNTTARLQALAVSRHDAVTMASIVETEAKRAEERPIIAAVYWNRLRKGMLLQADPTVQYALPAHVGRVLYKDLTVNSRFNTYKYPGLPPGPIASPGAAALTAALNPAAVPYLYFVADPDGHHEFRESLAEHDRAVAAARRKARASSPPRK